ncbi:Lactonase, 7-bladed beta-propeller-domain-containing protein [Podospora australis]|uniref:Lactonase, 7-bladed beta-propeller-domain-containing protein n=1 Tax=Podospora australis TaxID=1536484 RepID=A0AAN6X5I7_9PEZI|nr:Lactonase, 7-bladed beta-propeller-domain-containing protein [Podospora australis]
MKTSHGIVAVLSTGFSLAAAAACGKPPSFLYVSTYPKEEGTKGGVISLQLAGNKLQNLGKSDACGAYPSWLTLVGKNQLYCVDEAWPSTNGTFSSVKVGASGALTQLSKASTNGGPVSIAIFGDKNNGAAVAEYGSGAIDTFNLANPSAVASLHKQTFPAPTTPGAEAQKQARPHQAVVDPTGEFLIFPDLGSDLIRVYKVDKKTLQVTEKKSHALERQTGPRHAAFYKSGSKTYLYVINELANTLIGFQVTYGDGLTLTEIYHDTTHGNGKAVPAGTAAAEITFSPDNKFLTITSRLESSQTFKLANGTVVPSDPIITYSIDSTTGLISHVQTTAVGGVNPRHFSFNKDGSRVAAVAQADGRVIVFERDIASGKIGKVVAEAVVEGLPNMVIFRE